MIYPVLVFVFWVRTFCVSFCMKDHLFYVSHISLRNIVAFVFCSCSPLRQHALSFLLPSETNCFVLFSSPQTSIMFDDLDVCVSLRTSKVYFHITPLSHGCSKWHAQPRAWLLGCWKRFGLAWVSLQLKHHCARPKFTLIQILSLYFFVWCVMLSLELWIRSVVVFKKECSRKREHKMNAPLSTDQNYCSKNVHRLKLVVYPQCWPFAAPFLRPISHLPVCYYDG